jgi:plasmid maintenance system killer protein
MKNIIPIILLTISLNYILNKSNNIENIPSNLKPPLDDILEKESEDKNIFRQNENVTCTELEMDIKNPFSIQPNSEYCINFTNLNLNGSELLVYTDLYDAQNQITKLDVWNESLYNGCLVKFNGTKNKTGFIQIKKIPKGEFEINKAITREYFYNTYIRMLKGENKKKFFINIIPTDNNSDLYFFQTNKSSVRDENKNRMDFTYVNDFSKFGDDINALYINATKSFMKRERYINGKIEIFGYLYSNLNKEFNISISYKQIKGTGIVGPAVSLSVLFAALVVVVAFFIKNTYCDTAYRKRLSVVKEED